MYPHSPYPYPRIKISIYAIKAATTKIIYYINILYNKGKDRPRTGLECPEKEKYSSTFY
jgi:hypothetical protein